MNNLILATLPLFTLEYETLTEYCQVNIDRCSYHITHNLSPTEHDKGYMEGRMQAFEDILYFITPKN